MKILLMFSLVLVSFSAFAVNTSVSGATGGAGVASVEASDAPYSNPAALAYLKGYYFTTFYGSSKVRDVSNTQDFGLNLTDNMRDTVVPTSLAYVQSKAQGANETQDVLTRDFRLSFGNFVSQKFAFGLGVIHKDDQFFEERFNQTNLNVGTHYAANKVLGFALYAENVLTPNSRITEEYRLKQRTTAGMTYHYKKFVRLKADVRTSSANSADKPTIMAGLESYMNKWLVIRFGAQKDAEIEGDLYSAGLGFIGPKFGLHYAYQSGRQNKPTEENLSRHSIDLAIPIW